MVRLITVREVREELYRAAGGSAAPELVSLPLLYWARGSMSRSRRWSAPTHAFRWKTPSPKHAGTSQSRPRRSNATSLVI